MQGYNINSIYPLCHDEHLYPIKQLALWQHLFEEMGYEPATFLLMRELLDIESEFLDGVEYLEIR